MRHYLLTRAAYGPDVPLDVNRRRLDLTEGVLVRSLAVQTTKDVTWLVLVDPKDPLLDERISVLLQSGLRVVTGDAGRMTRRHRFDRPWGPWPKYIERDGPTLTTRIDDDDAFAPWVLERFREAAEARTLRKRIIWTLPVGWRTNAGQVNLRIDALTQFTALYSPSRDTHTIMHINHTSMDRLAPIEPLTEEPAWVWTRHDDARSKDSRASTMNRDAMFPLTDEIRAQFDIDWSLV